MGNLATKTRAAVKAVMCLDWCVPVMCMGLVLVGLGYAALALLAALQ